MPTEIRETAITSAGEQDVVRIRIADAAPDDPRLSFDVTILAHVSPRLMPSVAHVQVQAMKIAHRALGNLIAESESHIRSAGYMDELPPKFPRAKG
jgi:hypothetical protein